MSISTPDPNASSERALLFHAALLSGLGARARGVLAPPVRTPADDPDGHPDGHPALRSCIDAGSDTILSVRAPGGRGLRIIRRAPAGATESGAQRWLHEHHADGGATERWRTTAFGARSPEAWGLALESAGAHGVDDRLRRLHGGIGCHGRLLKVALRQGGNPEVWVSWQLDRRESVEAALRSVGLPDDVSTAHAVVERLVGRPLTSRSRPWSLSISLTDPTPRVRLGTTIWARLPDSSAKGRRLAAEVAAFGGDGRYAEALYKLLSADARGASVGRAVEVECRDGVPSTLEAYLALPRQLDSRDPEPALQRKP